MTSLPKYCRFSAEVYHSFDCNRSEVEAQGIGPDHSILRSKKNPSARQLVRQDGWQAAIFGGRNHPSLPMVAHQLASASEVTSSWNGIHSVFSVSLVPFERANRAAAKKRNEFRSTYDSQAPGPVLFRWFRLSEPIERRRRKKRNEFRSTYDSQAPGPVLGKGQNWLMVAHQCGLDTPRQLGRSERGTDHVHEDAGVGEQDGEAPRLDLRDDVGDARHSGRPLWQGASAKSMSFHPCCTSVPGQSPVGPARVMDDTAVGVSSPK